MTQDEIRQYNGHMLEYLWSLSDQLFSPVSGRELSDAGQTSAPGDSTISPAARPEKQGLDA